MSCPTGALRPYVPDGFAPRRKGSGRGCLAGIPCRAGRRAAVTYEVVKRGVSQAPRARLRVRHVRCHLQPSPAPPPARGDAHHLRVQPGPGRVRHQPTTSPNIAG
eukprot:191980-Pleurochrysis_carterae.AAC.3